MTLLEFAASVASIASLLFAAFVFYRSRIRETREQGNISVMRERLKGIANSLQATALYLQQTIRQADDPNTAVRELQNMARGVRAGLLSALADAQAMTITLENWSVGEALQSEPLKPPAEVDEPLKSPAHVDEAP